MGNEQFYSFLGMAARAGKAVFGAQAVDAGIKRGKVKLAIVDGAASENTKKSVRDACKYYHVPLIELEEMGKLGESVGKPDNKIMGIVCKDFAKSAAGKYSAHSGGEKLEQN